MQLNVVELIIKQCKIRNARNKKKSKSKALFARLLNRKYKKRNHIAILISPHPHTLSLTYAQATPTYEKAQNIWAVCYARQCLVINEKKKKKTKQNKKKSKANTN